MLKISENYSKKFYNILQFLLVCLISFTLSSCGFHPVYELRDKKAIPQIHISSINSVAGAELYRHLSDLLDNTPDAPYRLDIDLKYITSPLAITKNADVIEQTASQNVSYKLIHLPSKIAVSGSFTSSGSYNTTVSSYATYVEENQEGLNLARKAADEIHRRLIIYFSTHKIEE